MAPPLSTPRSAGPNFPQTDRLRGGEILQRGFQLGRRPRLRLFQDLHQAPEAFNGLFVEQTFGLGVQREGPALEREQGQIRQIQEGLAPSLTRGMAAFRRGRVS